MEIKLDREIQRPHIGSTRAAGADLKIRENMTLAAGATVTVDTGISMAIPEGYFGLVVPRSGMGRDKLIIANTVGIIDSDYRGNIQLALFNKSGDWLFLDEGTRVAQIILIPHLDPNNYVYVDSLDETDRGSGGFGSTGSK